MNNLLITTLRWLATKLLPHETIYTAYDFVYHLASTIICRSICFQYMHDSHQHVEWTLGPLRLRVTDNITIDYSDVELSFIIGPPTARLMIGYRWIDGEDAIGESGFVGRSVWRNRVKLFGF